MAEAFLSLDARERADILRTVAARSGRAAIILEKDIWVCRVLQALFSMPDPHPMAFKGGTSLSKVYRIIDRFSEDVDVTLDYRAFDDDFDPFAEGASRNQIRLFSERLKDRVATYIRDVVAPPLNCGRPPVPSAACPLPAAHAALLRSRPAVRPPYEPVLRGGADRIVGRQRIRRAPNGSGDGADITLRALAGADGGEVPARQQSLLGDRRRRSTRSKLAGLSLIGTGEAK